MFKISSKTAIHMERSQDHAYKMTNIDDILAAFVAAVTIFKVNIHNL